MNTMENHDNPTSPVALAAALAAAQSQGCGETCRRWRCRATLRRCVALALVIVSSLALAGSVCSSMAQGTWTAGAVSADESVDVVCQMLNKQ